MAKEAGRPRVPDEAEARGPGYISVVEAEGLGSFSLEEMMG